MSNRLDPDKTLPFVGPDLGLNCLEKLSADTLVSNELTVSKLNLPVTDLI